MTAQAITDIKELVGEMPARGCEFEDHDGNLVCDLQARWIARCHYVDWSTSRCSMVTVALCNSHKERVAANAAMSANGWPCGGCLRVLSPSDLFGPVMPL
ncbi:Uncharacterised protein [Mycobacteroides abscessus subsp. abscessus]|uniref:Uncharacterized protein n=1 Tax=Mycobacteroides abscessus TaxID=36809 RepID=A0AB33T4C7_9MYCO|nr:Uncharacterised protein [Mycobacteroides abscessus]SIF60077.1 Uncharacterised protein [Mycobacteroides abscessus subsp. abscessus]SLH31963.1 Uncharacterised protein [Mycobacteroides abscessus subsp. massiliense]CPT21092.1 Uncharacterised protein [Mycobacteroides abscessus]CPT25686.1 Uncharacterised protein [Mycobacteroides abscessus]